jgi:hypothetical protein
MKTTVYVLIALLAGMVLGNLPIKGDLRSARHEIDDLKKKLSSQNTGPGSLGGITSLLRLPETTRPAARGKAGGAPKPIRRAARPSPAPESVTVTTAPPVTPGSAFQPDPTPTNLNQMLETASSMWKTRADLARNSFVSNVTTSSDQAASFDVIMAAMNIRLSNSIRTWVDVMKQEADLTPESGVRIMNELSSSLVLAYDDLDRTMPEGWRTNAGPKFQVFDFIDPEVARPLTEVETNLKPKERDSTPSANFEFTVEHTP